MCITALPDRFHSSVHAAKCIRNIFSGNSIVSKKLHVHSRTLTPTHTDRQHVDVLHTLSESMGLVMEQTGGSKWGGGGTEGGG